MVPAVEPRRRLRAPRLRRKPSCSMAAITRSAVSGCTAGSTLTTRDTVLMLTPASWATSLIVARRREGLGPRYGPPGDNVVIVAQIAHHTATSCQWLTLRATRCQSRRRPREASARSPARLGFRAAGVVTSVLPASGALTPNKPSESGSAQAKVVRPYGDHAALVRSESIAAKDMTVSGPGGGGFVTFANLNGAEVNVQVVLSF